MKKILGWNLGLLAAGLVAAELAFGSWLYGTDLQMLTAPRQADLRFDVSELYSGGVAVYRRNNLGFRGDVGRPGMIDVLAVGGSTTNERYVSEGETWVDVLRRNFVAAGAPLVIANAGVDGHTTIGHLSSFDAWFARIPKLRPAYVILYVGINDTVVPEGGSPTPARASASSPSAPDASGWLVAAFKRHSALYTLHRTISGYFRSLRAGLVYPEGAAPGELLAESAGAPNNLAPDYALRLAAYRTRLEELDWRIHAMGAQAIYVTQTRGDARLVGGEGAGKVRGISADAVRVWHVLDLFNRVTMQVCGDKGAICVDLANEIEFEIGDFYDHVHTTSAGSRRIGEYLFDKLRNRVVPPRRAPI
jgi:lysophospholipase L1-like esterase